MAKTGGTKSGGSKSSLSSSTSNSNSMLNGTDWTDDPRAIMQVGQNWRATHGKADPSTYKGGTEAQTARVQQTLRQPPTPAPASQRPQGGGGSGPTITARPVGNDPAYLDMIYDQAFGPNGLPAPGAGKFPPTPKARPAWYGNPDLPQGNEEQAVQDAIDNGISVEQIAAGALGGGATALIAKSIIDRMRGKGVGDQPMNLGPDGKGPRAPRPTGDILKRNGLVQGQPTMNEDVARQFQELFGMPMPTNFSYGEFSEGGGNEPRLIPGSTQKYYPDGSPIDDGSEPYEVYERPLSNPTIPGPNQNVKQLGDMDSPTYRNNFGYTETTNAAERIVRQMQMYDDYDIEKYVDPSANPALVRTIQNLLRTSF